MSSSISFAPVSPSTKTQCWNGCMDRVAAREEESPLVIDDQNCDWPVIEKPSNWCAKWPTVKEKTLSLGTAALKAIGSVVTPLSSDIDLFLEGFLDIDDFPVFDSCEHGSPKHRYRPSFNIAVGTCAWSV